MPTGYTYRVQKGEITTLRDFAMECARGMGALIMMRDEPTDAPIPERFEPSTPYHDEALTAARAVLAELPGLSDEECDKRAAQAYAEAMARWQERQDECAAGVARYDAMKALVEPWEGAPEGLKEFMLSQLSDSRSFDGPRKYDEPPKPLSGAEWQRQAVEKAASDVGYHERERAKEITRTEERNRWIAQLRAALPDADQ